jgi:hypothetical protein
MIGLSIKKTLLSAFNIKYFVIGSRYFSNLVGFLSIKVMTEVDALDSIAILIAMQSMLELAAVADFGNRNRIINGGYLRLNLFFPTIIFLFFMLLIYLVRMENWRYLVLCLGLLWASYPLILNGFVNLYEKNFLSYCLPLIVLYIILILNWAFLYYSDSKPGIILLFMSVVLPQLVPGLFNLSKVRFSFSYQDRHFRHGIHSACLYGSSFLGISVIYILGYDSAAIVFVALFMRILTLTNVLGQSFNLFASEFRQANGLQLSASDMYAVVAQIIVSYAIFHFFILLLFPLYADSLGLVTFLLFIATSFAFIYASKLNAYLIANGYVKQYFLIEVFPALILLPLRLFSIQSIHGIIGSIFIFYAASVFIGVVYLARNNQLLLRY